MAFVSIFQGKVSREMEIYQILVQVWQKCFTNSASSPEAPGDSISLDFLTLSEKIHLSDCNNSSGASIFIGSSIALGNAWSDCGWIEGSNRDSLSSTHVDDLDRELSVSELQAKLYI